MRNKKGFIFVETMIVITILSVALIMLYRGFSTGISHEQRRIEQDHTLYIYRTHYIADFLRSNDALTAFKLIFDSETSNQITCDFPFPIAGNTELCEYILSPTSVLEVNAVYLLNEDVDYILNNDVLLYSFRPQAISYLKTINDTLPCNTSGGCFRIFIEFKSECEQRHSRMGTDTDQAHIIDICRYRYASLKV